MTGDPGETGAAAETDATAASGTTAETGTAAAPDAAAATGARSPAGTTAGEAGGTGAPGARRGVRKVREGVVISGKMTSTVVVAVTERVRHTRYGKIVQRTRKLYAHDDSNQVKAGDRVRVMETRPYSKLKRWRVTSVVERAR